jgi:hypothetical protein
VSSKFVKVRIVAIEIKNQRNMISFFSVAGRLELPFRATEVRDELDPFVNFARYDLPVKAFRNR